MSAILQAGNISQGTTLIMETSALPGGAMEVIAFTPPLRSLPLTGARSDAGVGLTATATGGAMGVSRTAGTSLSLVGETTSSSAVTDKAIWEFDLPDTYNAGAAVPVVVNASIAGSGTITAASCTMALAVYSETNGVEAELTVTGGAQKITAAGADINWTIAASNNLTVGQRLVAEVTMLITTATGANTGHVNKAAFGA